MSIVDKAQSIIENLKKPGIRPPFEAFYTYILALVIGYAMADLAALYVRPMMLPTEPPPQRPSQPSAPRPIVVGDYRDILSRNLFNESGEIPPALADDEDTFDPDQQEAVPSQLPLTLLGTIVHFNPKLSIASISLDNRNENKSFRAGENIETIAEITKIERKRVTFINSNNRRLEYIEISEDQAFSLAVAGPAPEPEPQGLVQQRGNDFTLRRSDLEDLTSNLSEILQQARMEPRITPDNTIDGFCFSNIMPGSVYETFGFRVGDCIKSVEGEPVTSPQKAMELYNLLRSANNVQLGVERGGRDEVFNYTIR